MFGINTGSKMRPAFKKSIAAVAVSTAMLLSSQAAIAADKVNGAVKGKVAVESGVNLSDVVVVITHDTKGLTRTTSTDAEGKFNIKGLPIGSYTITFSKDGFQTIEEQKLNVKAGNTAGLTVAMYSADIERISVTGNSVTFIDYGNSTAQTTLTSEELDLLPVNQDLTSVALLSPSSSLAADQDGDYGRGASFNGSSVAENGYFLNGMNITDIRKGLGYIDIPWEAIAQTNVVTSGVSSEYGQFIGGVTDMVTKSGSNEFKFGVSAVTTPSSLRENKPDTWGVSTGESNFGDRQLKDLNSEDKYEWTSYNIYASGAIVEDTLFFYGVFNPQKVTDEYATEGGSFGRKTKDADYWLAKIDWYIGDNHSIGITALNNEWEQDYVTASFDVDTLTRTGDLSDPAPSSWGGSLWSINYTGILTDDITVSALYGVTEQDAAAINPTADTNRVWWQNDDYSWERRNGWVEWYKDNLSNDKRTQMRVDLDWELDDHTIRIGFSDEAIEVTDKINYAGDGYRYEYYQMDSGWLNWINGERAAAGQAAVTHELNTNFLVQREYVREGTAKTGSRAFYIQDSWRVTDEVTVNLGLRNSSFYAETGEGDKYIDMGNQWAPRLGATWDVNGDGRTKAFFNTGRYYMPVSPNTSVRMTLGEKNQYSYVKFDSVDDNYVPVNPEVMHFVDYGDGTFTQPYQTLVDADLEPMYNDEFSIGFEHEINDNWVAGVRYIHQSLNSSIEDTNMKYVLDKWSAENPAEAAKLDPNWNTSSSWIGIVMNPGRPVRLAYDQNQDGTVSDDEGVTWSPEYIGLPEAKRKYQGLEFTLEGKPTENSNLRASYTYSESKGNTEGLVSGVHSQADPGWSGSFDSPEFTDHAYGNTSNDIPHKVKLFGNYEFTESFNLGFVMLAHEGRARNILGYHPGDVDSCAPEMNITSCSDKNRNNFYSNGQPSPRGAGGYGDWVTSLDLNARYTMDVGPGRLSLYATVYNVFNASTATTYNDMSEYGNTVGQMDPNYGNPTSYQAPRYVELTARFDF